MARIAFPVSSSSTTHGKVVEAGVSTPETLAHDPPDTSDWITQVMSAVLVVTMPPSGSVSLKVTVSPAAGLRFSTARVPASSTSPTVTVTSLTLTLRRLDPLWTSVATTLNS